MDKKKYDSDIVGWATINGNRVPIRKSGKKLHADYAKEARQGFSKDQIVRGKDISSATRELDKLSRKAYLKAKKQGLIDDTGAIEYAKKHGIDYDGSSKPKKKRGVITDEDGNEYVRKASIGGKPYWEKKVGEERRAEEKRSRGLGETLIAPEMEHVREKALKRKGKKR